jgi:hypothetical protein
MAKEQDEALDVGDLDEQERQPDRQEIAAGARLRSPRREPAAPDRQRREDQQQR